MERRMPERRMPERKSTPKNNPAKKMAKNMSTFAFVTGLVVIVIIFIFYQHKNQEISDDSGNVATTEVEKLATKDLEVGYPATPTEVMKLFGRINQCMYNNPGMDEEDFAQLLSQLRVLYSSELLGQNTLEEQKENLKAEISEFKSSKRRIVNYTVDKSSSVQYRTIEGKECADLQMAFFMSENGKYSKSFQEYILIKENNDWKIYAFRKSSDAGQEKSKS